VEPERLDDVAFRIVERPEPPRRPPRGPRWALAIVACLLTTGALAAGASALTGGEDEPGRATAKPRPQVSYTAGGVPFVRDGAECRAGERVGHRKRKREAAALER
jgi:hypothetical protein